MLNTTESSKMPTSTEWEKAQRGELYRAFVPELIVARGRSKHACNRFNGAGETSRRRLVELWREYVSPHSHWLCHTSFFGIQSPAGFPQ